MILAWASPFKTFFWLKNTYYWVKNTLSDILLQFVWGYAIIRHNLTVL